MRLYSVSGGLAPIAYSSSSCLPDYLMTMRSMKSRKLYCMEQLFLSSFAALTICHKYKQKIACYTCLPEHQILVHVHFF